MSIGYSLDTQEHNKRLAIRAELARELIRCLDELPLSDIETMLLQMRYHLYLLAEDKDKAALMSSFLKIREETL